MSDRCARCGAPPAGVVSVAELDDGRAARPVAEVALCAACMAGVAAACGFGAYVPREDAR